MGLTPENLILWVDAALVVVNKPAGMLTKEKGKPALTILRVIQRFIEPGYGDYALVEATPKTGRTHQVRVHLFTVGFPPVADPLYGDEIHPAYHRLASFPI